MPGMLDGLGNELSQTVALYKNRMNLFGLNGSASSGFSIRNVVRSSLFAKAEGAGLTPIPSLRFYDWVFDLACLRGVRLEMVFVIRENRSEDYRQLLLLPRTVKRVLVALTNSAAPQGELDFEVVRVPYRPTEPIRTALPARKVIDEYYKAFKEVYRIEPFHPRNQLVNAATRLSNFWPAHGGGFDFYKYCVWFMAERAGRQGGRQPEFVTLRDLLDHESAARFKAEQQRSVYDGDWTDRGWGR